MGSYGSAPMLKVVVAPRADAGCRRPPAPIPWADHDDGDPPVTFAVGSTVKALDTSGEAERDEPGKCQITYLCNRYRHVFMILVMFSGSNHFGTHTPTPDDSETVRLGRVGVRQDIGR